MRRSRDRALPASFKGRHRRNRFDLHGGQFSNSQQSQHYFSRDQRANDRQHTGSIQRKRKQQHRWIECVFFVFLIPRQLGHRTGFEPRSHARQHQSIR